MFPSKQTKVKFHGNSLEVNMQVALIPTSLGLTPCSYPYRLVTNLRRFIKLIFLEINLNFSDFLTLNHL